VRGASEPVTVIVTRRVKPGCEAKFEAWLEEVHTAATRFPGHSGVSVVRPSDPAHPEYLIVFRFDTQTHLDAWRRSSVRRALFERSAGLAEEPPQERTLGGLETCFALPDGQVVRPPARWKTWALSSAAIYPLITAITLGAGPLLGRCRSRCAS
jgi:antibiotic biosynthesis monooxygenase (ABM) superfamily enzyme